MSSQISTSDSENLDPCFQATEYIAIPRTAEDEHQIAELKQFILSLSTEPRTEILKAIDVLATRRYSSRLAQIMFACSMLDGNDTAVKE